jgi:hypothetical protein
MKTVRRILNQLRSLIEPDGARRRERVERTPVVEPMEPRALLSGMEPGGATVLPPHHSGAELVIPSHQPSSFHVLYQAIHEGELSASVEHASVQIASTAQQASAQAMSMTPADAADDDSTDDTNDDDGDGDDDDGDGDDDDVDGDDDDNNGDEVDDENDP